MSSLLSNSIQEKVNVPHANANIMEGLALSYSREKPGSRERVELLSCVAQQYTNKEIKQMFRFTNTQGEVSCTDYELTKARLHRKMYGPGAALPKIRHQCSHNFHQKPLLLPWNLSIIQTVKSIHLIKMPPVMENKNHG